MQKNKYVAVNVENICSVPNLTGNQAKIFNHMILNMDYDNYFYLSETQKESICKKLGIASQTLNNNTSEMSNKGLIMPIGRCEFLVAKKYAVKGVPRGKVNSGEMLYRPYDGLNELYNFTETLDRRKGYVYAIGHFPHSSHSVKDVSNAFYVGKSCSVLTDRLSSHTKREKGAEALVIEFNSHAETDYAEKVLINYLKPRKNKETYTGFENECYAKILLKRVWDVAKVYESDGKEYLNDKVEIN